MSGTLAKRAKIIQYGSAGPYDLFIDDQDFPWLTVDGIVVSVSKGGLTTVIVSIAIDGPVEVACAAPRVLDPPLGQSTYDGSFEPVNTLTVDTDGPVG